MILLLARLMGHIVLLAWRLSSVVVCNTAGGRAGRRARERSGGRNSTAGQSCYFPLGRHLVDYVIHGRSILMYERSL